MRTRFVISAILVAATLFAAPGPSSAQPSRALILEAIEVEPTRRGMDDVIADLAGLEIGQEIDAEDLRAARRTIARSGWFEEVEVYTRAGSEPGRLVLRVEGPLDDDIAFETGVGSDPLDGWYLNLIGARMHHVIEEGSTARANVQFSERRTTTRFEFELPRVAGTNLDLLFDMGGGSEDWFAYSGDTAYRQSIDRSYARLGARTHLSRSTALEFWIGGSSADPGDIDLSLGTENGDFDRTQLVGPFGDRERYSDARIDLTWDRRDRVQPWRNGSWGLLRLETSRPNDDGPTFIRTRAAYRGALGIPGQQALALRADLAWADRGTPYHLRPIFGGLGSVRGFRDASLSGGRGARATAATALEWRVPLHPRASRDPRVHGVLFVDTGRFIDADGDLGPWSTSVGWGVRVRLPWIERVSFDSAIPLTPTSTKDSFWVHASLGFGF